MVLVISSLSSGGAERVMSQMANYWVQKQWDVSIVTLSSTASDFYTLDLRVRRVGLDLLKPSANLTQSMLNIITRIYTLRKTLTTLSPQVVISFMDITNIVTLVAVLGKNIPVIVSERVDPANARLGFFRNYLRRKLYPHAAAVVLQTEQVAAWARKFVPNKKLKIIHNPMYQPDEVEGIEDDPDLAGKYIIAIGRLNEQKGFDVLIKAFSSVCTDNWSLVILGEGSERVKLETLIVALGMESKIVLMGRVNNVSQYLTKAELFVLSSRFEGFPNVLLEAMGAGLPVISFDCPSGPGVILHHGEDGLLVPPGDVAGLADAMSRLMANDQERRRLGKNALAARERFSKEKIMGEWEKLIGTLVAD